MSERNLNESVTQSWVVPATSQVTAAVEAVVSVEVLEGIEPLDTETAGLVTDAVIESVSAPSAPAAAPVWMADELAINPEEIEANRAKRIDGNALPWEELPVTASSMFEAPQLEKLIGSNDLVPAYWLELGAARSRTVCKVDAGGVDYKGRRGSWSGTGFLVARNILCTNHHVINSLDVAKQSRALFDFSADPDGGVRDAMAFRLRPDLLFWTSPATEDGGLDATFVAVEGQPGDTYGFNQLLRQSFSIAEGDKVNIIQHPSGRLKEVALRDNTVTSVKNPLVVHYQSDTEPGSSGAAAYNDAWELIALHHASTRDMANEGIKFSALANAIEQDAQRADPAAQKLLQLFKGADELMGFFGGLGRRVDPSAPGVERVQDTYRGEAQDLDIGFWNIEWFNKRWRDKLDAVARVVVEMNLDVWVLVESSEEATIALAKHLSENYAGDWGVLASQDAASVLQITTVLWNRKTVDVEKTGWPEATHRWFEVHSEDFDDLLNEAVHGKVFDRYPARYTVNGKIGGEPISLNLVPVHLKAMAEGSTRRQMASRALAEAIAETAAIEGEQGDWMIGGDFNATLASNDMAALSDAKFTPISAKDAEQQQFTYVKSPYKSLIDHIYVSPNLAKVTDDQFVIVALDRTIDRFLTVSDHRPILVRLSSVPGAGVQDRVGGLTDEERARLTRGLSERRRPTPSLSLEEARRQAADQSVYYASAADDVLRDDYYAGLAPQTAGFETRVQKLLAETHATQLRYQPARHLYPWVDLQPNGKVRSVYSLEESTPEAYIAHDLEMDRRRGEALEALKSASRLESTDSLEAMLEAEFQYNCEHVVPQSWFNKAEPMRGDLHHLFACETRCNSFRSNYPYTTFTAEKTMENCGRMEVNEFEPKGGKGAVARATLYFMLRYPGKISKRYKGDDLENLLQWHRENPPDEWERHRNLAIHISQGNRNPFIDFPDWAGQLFG